MKFPLSKIDIKKYHDKIFELIKDDKCRIYIDTNIIALFYGIHDSARKEFFDWLKELIRKKRVKVPVWVIHEYTNRFIRNQVQDYLSPLKKVASIKKDFEQVTGFLKMHIEDSNLTNSNYDSAEEFKKDLNDIQEKLNKIAFAAKNKDDKYKLKIHDEINSILGNCILSSNIEKILTNVDCLGEIRYNHKLPPGFEDGNKDLNAHGDLILWHEILQNCKIENIKKAILITDDEKKDWVYAPNKLIINKKERNNTKPQFKIADPRLIHEFQVATKSDEFHIISFELLTKILIENISNSFTKLASALQLVHSQTADSEVDKYKSEDVDKEDNIEEEKEGLDKTQSNTSKGVTLEEKESKKETLNKTHNTEQKIEVAEEEKEEKKPKLPYSIYALADRDFPLVDNNYFTNVIEQLKSYNWYIQNPCIEAFSKFNSKPIKESTSNNDFLFVIGRNIYQAACGGSGSAIDFIENLRQKFSKYTDYFINHLYSGILFEIYFDSSSTFRGDKLKSYHINSALEVIDSIRLKPAKLFIETALKDYEQNLLYLPYKNEKVKIVITFENEQLIIKDWLDNEVSYLRVKEIQGNGVDLLTEKEENALDIYYPDMNVFGLVDLICKTYGIPSNYYSTEIKPEVDINLSVDMTNKKLATIITNKA